MVCELADTTVPTIEPAVSRSSGGVAVWPIRLIGRNANATRSQHAAKAIVERIDTSSSEPEMFQGWVELCLSFVLEWSDTTWAISLVGPARPHEAVGEAWQDLYSGALLEFEPNRLDHVRDADEIQRMADATRNLSMVWRETS